ncbi:hypothetical protein UFOVP1454_16 [uncultured Caudovirales phage]|uniref:Uncharacterized protein n=1 Tax=uncultured Caudovirales phage TaxID=2100421 RepID=A0A6J5SIC1_9CAUD|nr:hypothetical protein UFOVP1454_16 [uncultured Caudovirales phage]
MKSKEEMIEVMADALRDECLKMFGSNWSNDKAERFGGAALKALCGALPDVNMESNLSNIASRAELYNQLKQWGK